MYDWAFISAYRLSCMCSPGHHTPGRSSRIISRTHIGWPRNQCPPILSILETIRVKDFFQICVFLTFRWLSMLVSFPSYLTSLQPSALTLPLSSRYVDYFNNGFSVHMCKPVWIKRHPKLILDYYFPRLRVRCWIWITCERIQLDDLIRNHMHVDNGWREGTGTEHSTYRCSCANDRRRNSVMWKRIDHAVNATFDADIPLVKPVHGPTIWIRRIDEKTRGKGLTLPAAT